MEVPHKGRRDARLASRKELLRFLAALTFSCSSPRLANAGFNFLGLLWMRLSSRVVKEDASVPPIHSEIDCSNVLDR